MSVGCSCDVDLRCGLGMWTWEKRLIVYAVYISDRFENRDVSLMNV